MGAYYLLCCRKSALEQALSEKQDFLSLLADCLAWLNKAEKHLKNQKPLGGEARVVANQLRVHQVSHMYCIKGC